jgi:hypothetical protein
MFSSDSPLIERCRDACAFCGTCLSRAHDPEPRKVQELELVIVGAGAAGLSAAIYAGLMQINHVVLDAEDGGGLMSLAKTVENIPGGGLPPEILPASRGRYPSPSERAPPPASLRFGS